MSERQHRLRVSVCPAEEVDAPVDVVWRLLANPAEYGSFWDLHVERVEPPGRAITGQKISGWTRELCRRFKVSGAIVDVDAEHHTVQFRMTLPFSVASDNRISCTPIDASRCLVRFG